MTVVNDLTYSVRRLAVMPFFSCTVMLTLALGLGATTSMFSMLHAAVLRPLPFAAPERLVWIWATRVDRDKAFFSVADFLDQQRETRLVEAIGAVANWGANLTGTSEARRLQGIQATGNITDLLGIRAHIGRLLTPQDDTPSSARVVVLSYGLWRQQFGGDPGVLGRTVLLNGEAFSIIGVLPESFVFPNVEVEMMAPLRPEADPRRHNRGSNFLRAFARIKPDVSPAQLQSELGGITERLRQRFPQTNAKKTTPRVLWLHEELVGASRPLLLLVFCATGLVLLLMCANLAHLLLVRSAASRRDAAVRLALGASRAAIARQLIVEALLLASSGAALGLLASWKAIPVLARLGGNISRIGDAAVNGTAVAFAVIAAVLTAVLVSLLPIFELRRQTPGDALGRSRTVTGRQRRTRAFLIAAEAALCMAVVAGAFLVAGSVLNLQRVSTGVQPNRVVTARVSLPILKYGGPDAIPRFIEEVSSRLADVDVVAATNVLPLSGMNVRSDFVISGRAVATATETPGGQHRWVTPDYFRAMGVPVRRGRGFDDTDRAGARQVVIIDEALAERFWPGADPLGSRIHLLTGTGPGPAWDVVGVAGNVKHAALDESPTGTFYAPLRQVTPEFVAFVANSLSLVVRARQSPDHLVPVLRQAIRQQDPDVPVSAIRPMRDLVDAALAPRRFAGILMSVFAFASVLLAASGMAAITAATALDRTREFGIRVAVGATAAHVRRHVMRDALVPGFAGVLVGGAIVRGGSGLLQSLLFQASPSDSRVLLLAAALLLTTCAVGAYIPAARAARLDPLRALRGVE